MAGKKIKIISKAVAFEISVPEGLSLKFLGKVEKVGHYHTAFEGDDIRLNSGIKGNTAHKFEVAPDKVDAFTKAIAAFCKKHGLEFEK